MVGIIDIGFGNIRSITNWLDRSTISYKVLSLSNNLSEFDLILRNSMEYDVIQRNSNLTEYDVIRRNST